MVILSWVDQSGQMGANFMNRFVMYEWGTEDCILVFPLATSLYGDQSVAPFFKSHLYEAWTTGYYEAFKPKLLLYGR